MIDLRTALIERRFVELSPELATHYLTFNTFDSQRNIKEKHLSALAKKMESGLFRFGEVAFATNGEEGDIMMNGQHICHAVCRSEITIPCVLERFNIENGMDLSILFRQFELETRSLSDMVKVEKNSLGLGWTLNFSRLIVAAAKLSTVNKRSNRLLVGVNISKEDSVQLLQTYLKEGAHVLSIIEKKSQGSHLWRRAIVFTMFLTFHKDPEASKSFWEKVKDGENLTKDMPEMKLRNFLVQSLFPSKKSTGRTSEHELIYKSILAWNASRAGRHTTLPYRPYNKIPKML